MAKGGQNWKSEWFGKLGASRIAVVMLSPSYFESDACVKELTAICQQLDSSCILVVHMEKTSMQGNFLKDCDQISLSEHEKEQRSNYFRVAISGNMIPPPERGLFGENFAANVDTLVKRARQIMWG